MNNASVAPRLHKQHHLRHSFIYEGVDYFVPVYVDGPTTTVKIHDLPPQMPNSLITKNLQQYGKVLSIQNDVWKNYFSGVPNGVRVVRMRMEKPLPVYITVDSHRSYVSYPKEPLRTSSNVTEKQALPGPSSEQKRNENQRAPQSVHSDSSDDDTGDDDNDDDGGDNDDDGSSNEHDNREETTVESSGKRRLSTETSHSGTTVENEPKRSCSRNRQIDEQRTNAEWKVYQTRSRRKNESEAK